MSPRLTAAPHLSGDTAGLLFQTMLPVVCPSGAGSLSALVTSMCPGVSLAFDTICSVRTYYFFSTKCTTLGGILKGLHSTTTIPHRDSEHFQPAQKTSSCPLSHSPNPTHSGSNHCSFITEHGFPLFCQENASVRTLTVGIDLQPILLGSEISHLLCGRTHFLLAAPSSDWVW